jgi:hypothetical protein
VARLELAEHDRQWTPCSPDAHAARRSTWMWG